MSYKPVNNKQRNRSIRRKGGRIQNMQIKAIEQATKLFLTNLLVKFAQFMDQNIDATLEEREKVISELDVKWIDHINKSPYIDKEKGSMLFRNEVNYYYEKVQAVIRDSL